MVFQERCIQCAVALGHVDRSLLVLKLSCRPAHLFKGLKH